MKSLSFYIIYLLTSLSVILAQDALREAVQLSEQHQYQLSSDVLLTFIEEHPQRKYDIGRAWIMHSHNLLELGQIAEAKVANDNSLNLRMQLRSGDIAENYLCQAEISLLSGNANDALVASQQGMQMLIENPRLYAELNKYAARALIEMRRIDEAIQYFRTAKEVLEIEVGKKDPAYGKLLYEGGKLLLGEKRYQGAFEYFSEAFFAQRSGWARFKSLVAAWGTYQLKENQG